MWKCQRNIYENWQIQWVWSLTLHCWCWLIVMKKHTVARIWKKILHHPQLKFDGAFSQNSREFQQQWTMLSIELVEMFSRMGISLLLLELHGDCDDVWKCASPNQFSTHAGVQVSNLFICLQHSFFLSWYKIDHEHARVLVCPLVVTLSSEVELTDNCRHGQGVNFSYIFLSYLILYQSCQMWNEHSSTPRWPQEAHSTPVGALSILDDLHALILCGSASMKPHEKWYDDGNKSMEWLLWQVLDGMVPLAWSGDIGSFSFNFLFYTSRVV